MSRIAPNKDEDPPIQTLLIAKIALIKYGGRCPAWVVGDLWGATGEEVEWGELNCESCGSGNHELEYREKCWAHYFYEL